MTLQEFGRRTSNRVHAEKIGAAFNDYLKRAWRHSDNADLIAFGEALARWNELADESTTLQQEAHRVEDGLWREVNYTKSLFVTASEARAVVHLAQHIITMAAPLVEIENRIDAFVSKQNTALELLVSLATKIVRSHLPAPFPFVERLLDVDLSTEQYRNLGSWLRDREETA